MKKTINLIIALLAFGSTMLAQTSGAQTSARKEIHDNMLLCASNYVAYPDPTVALTPAPKGYEPFYLTHYGRHGSRWLIGDWEYKKAIDILEDAKEKGVLKPQGEYLLEQLKAFYACTRNRLGELTGVGERQHHRIGRRMTEHFPEIFKAKNSQVDARSTVVIRCILSMVAECEEITAFNPNIKIHNDVSNSLQYYLNREPWEKRISEARDARWKEVTYDYNSKNLSCGRFWDLLFTDPNYRYKNDPHRSTLQKLLFDIAGNMQSHFGNRVDNVKATDGRSNDVPFNPLYAGESKNHPSLKGIPGTALYDYFTEDEAYGLWRIKNTEWYVGYAAGIAPFTQRNLLENFLQTADTIAVPTKVEKRDGSGTQLTFETGGRHAASLRFGHEVCVMPMAALLELGNSYPQVPMSRIDTLDNVWANFRIYPMASNIQLIFYRPKKGNGDVLVKALLNEREVTLPGTPVSGPYYRWAELREYYLKKIADYDAAAK